MTPAEAAMGKPGFESIFNKQMLEARTDLIFPSFRQCLMKTKERDREAASVPPPPPNIIANLKET